MKHTDLLAGVLSFVVFDSLGGTTRAASPEATQPADGSDVEYAASISAYFPQNSRNYASPVFTADCDKVHVEARFNYEALETGSAWVGRNFSFGEKLAVEITPMFGGVAGDINGFAPGYTLSASYGPLEFFTQGEYFFDLQDRSGNFFYNWSEFSCVPAHWIRFGLVLDRTKALGNDFDVRRGPLLGFRYKKLDITTYWLSPGSSASTFVLAMTVNF